MFRSYQYVGPQELWHALEDSPSGTVIKSSTDVISWIKNYKQEVSPDGLYWVTYTMLVSGELCIADRHSEHVACASGGPVLAAGELAFDIALKSSQAKRNIKSDGDKVKIIEASNQSTGFCPEPDCWKAVKHALKGTGIIYPNELTYIVCFRLCNHCNQRNIVKDNYFVCSCCGEELPKEWNF